MSQAWAFSSIAAAPAAVAVWTTSPSLLLVSFQFLLLCHLLGVVGHTDLTDVEGHTCLPMCVPSVLHFVFIIFTVGWSLSRM